MWIKEIEKTTEGREKRTRVGREAKFGKEESGAGGKDKKRGKQIRGEIREDMIDCIPGEEMARLQRSHRFKIGPPFQGHHLQRAGLEETVSEKW